MDFPLFHLDLIGNRLLKQFYKIALVVSLAQFIIGPIVLMTLPKVGWSVALFWTIGFGVFFSMLAIYFMIQELTEKLKVGKRLYLIAGLLTVTIFCMASGRHLYRETALKEHKQAVKEKTEMYTAKVKEAQNKIKNEDLQGALDMEARGRQAFRLCMACHALDKKLVGPPIREIQKLYVNNPEGIVAWTKSPGRRRPDYPPMAPIRIPDEELRAVAEYILKM